MNNLYIFDLDGTLIDSKIVVYECYKKVIIKLIPDKIGEVDSMLIGPSLAESAAQLLGKNNMHLLDEFIKMFISIHDNRMLDRIVRFEHADRLLKFLFKGGHSIMIATNKRSYPTLKIVEQFGWTKYFVDIFSANETVSKEEGVGKLLKTNSNTEFKEMFFIGDTVSDGLIAAKYDMKFLRAKYGYGEKENWLKVKIFQDINSLDEIISIN
jgi:phosphoglycolate phosphatase